MKKRNLSVCWIAFCLAISTLVSRAQNIPIEYGPHPGPWWCLTPGSVPYPGTVLPTHIDACVGETIVKPTFATSPTFVNWVKRRTVTRDTGSSYTEDAPVAYLPRILYFEDEQGNLMPDVFNSFGDFTYTAKVRFVPSPLAGWWPAEDNANDVVFQNHGIVQGGLTFGAGKVGQGFVFSTSTAHVRVPANPNLNVGANGLTIEAWIKPSDLSKRNPIVEWNNGTGLFGVHFYILGPAEFNLGPGNLFLSLTDTSGEHHWMHAPGGTVTTTDFYHVAATYDNTPGSATRGWATIYRNGAVVKHQYLGIFTLQTKYDLYLGRRPSGDGIFNYSGLMDEVSIYNCTLSQGDIQNIYNAGIAGKGKCKDGSPAGCAALPAGCVCAPVTAPVGPVTVTVRAKPSITLGGATLEVFRGGAPKVVDGGATLTDPDSLNFNGGKLTVEFSVGSRMSGDVLSILNQGTEPGQIGVTNSVTVGFFDHDTDDSQDRIIAVNGAANVSYQNSTIGTFSGGRDPQPLVVTLNSSATPAAVQALLQNITYQYLSTQPPPTTPRPLRFSITDGPGGSGCASAVVSKNINIICAERVEVQLLIDRSGSTASWYSDTLPAEKTAAQFFLTHLRYSVDPLVLKDKVGVIAYCGKDSPTPHRIGPGPLDNGPVPLVNPQSMTPLTPVFATANNAISAIVQICDSAVYGPVLGLARTNLPPSDALRLIILLTDDGIDPYRNENTTPGLVNYSLTQAAIARAAGIRVVTIGFDGSASDPQAHAALLQNMASSLGDSYLTNPSGLIGVLSTVARTICRSTGLGIGNQPPVVTAPDNSTIDFPTPGSASLVGTVTDDGLPSPPAAHTISWSKVSGPGPVYFSPDPTYPANASATFTMPGVYTIRLTASDSLLSASDEVVITVQKDNEAPVVDAGPDQTVLISDYVYLPGAASDDGGSPTVQWSVIEKPVGALDPEFDSTTSASTYVKFKATEGYPAVYKLRLTATDSQPSSTSDDTIITVNDVTAIQNFYDMHMVSAGVGGMRKFGNGTITLSGLSGNVRKAFLYWHGPTSTVNDPEANGVVFVNGRYVVGTNIGTAYDNHWTFCNPLEQDPLYLNSQAYRADVTALVSCISNGVYSLTGFAKGVQSYDCWQIDVNGASLIVFFEDESLPDPRDFILWSGNDSNDAYPPGGAPSEPAGWSQSFSGIKQVMPPAHADLWLHVSDGQDFSTGLREGPLQLSSETIRGPDHIFNGNTVPANNTGPAGDGSLWDIVTFVIPSSLLAAENNNLALSLAPHFEDWVSLVAAVVDLPSGSGPRSDVTRPAKVGIPYHPPVARNDVIDDIDAIFTNGLNVLANDSAAPGQCMSILSVTPPKHGNVIIGYNGSVLLYKPSPGFPGTDEFTYTITDDSGGTATATVSLTGTPLPGINCEEALVGEITSQDPFSRDANNSDRHADTFAFLGAKNERVKITVTADPFYVFLFDPSGKQVGRSVFDGSDNVLDYTLEIDGVHTFEVTPYNMDHSHYTGDPYQPPAGQQHQQPATYTVKLSCLGILRTPLVLVDGVQVPNHGTFDFGITGVGEPVSKEMVIANLDQTPLTIPGFIVIDPADDDNNPDFYIEDPDNPPDPPSPNLQLQPGESVTLHLIFGVRSGSEGPTGPGTSPISWHGVLYFASDRLSINPDETFRLNLSGYANLEGGDPPTVSISTPSSQSVFYTGTGFEITVNATAQTAQSPPNFISRVEVWAAGPRGRNKIGDFTVAPYTMSATIPEPGNYVLTAWAFDDADHPLGRAAVSAPVPITVVNAPPNARPVAVNDEATVAMNTSANEIKVLLNDYDPNGDPLAIIAWTQGGFGTVTLAPGGTSLRYSPDGGTYGTDFFTYTISDGRNNTATAFVQVEVARNIVAITSPSAGPLSSGSVTIQATASTSHGAIHRVDFYANRHLLGSTTILANNLYSYDWTVSTPGDYSLVAVAMDSRGFALPSAPVVVSVDGGGGPVARIGNVNEGDFIRDGLFELRGTASGPGTVQYRVELYKPESEGLIRLQTLIPQGGGQNDFAPGPKAEGDVLGTNDFTSFRNGVYVLRLTVDANSAQQTAEVRFILDTEAKVGHLTFSEQDVVIPVGGLPLSVIRTYNSQNLNKGEFGYSWTFAIDDVELEIDEGRADTPAELDPEPGEPVESVSMRIGGGRNVTLTLPDGRRTTFQFVLEPGSDEDGAPCFCYEAKWRPPPGVYATLTPLDNNVLQFLPWQSFFEPYWLASGGPQTPWENFDFRGFMLTNEDGTVYEIVREELGSIELEPDGILMREVRQAYGQAKVTNIWSRAGERIEIKNDVSIANGQTKRQINHYTAPTEAAPGGVKTRSLLVRKDSAGRIYEIYDPAGLGQDGEPTLPARPVVKYEYYPDSDPLRRDNLKQVMRLTDRGGGVYVTTTYLYDNQNHPHFITGIQDDRGLTVLDNTVVNGRLTQTLDAAGKTNKFEHDLNGRKEIITDRSGNRTIHEYDGRGNVVRTINALGQTTTQTYDDSHNVLTGTDATGKTTTYEYDGRGNRTRILDPLGHETILTYNHFGQVLTGKDANNKTTINEYDAAGNLTNVAQYLNEGQPSQREIITTHDYDTRGNLTQTTDPLGNKTVYAYNVAGDKLLSVTVKNAVAETVSFTEYPEAGYDANGNRTIERVKRNLQTGEILETHSEYDAQNRLVKTFDPDGNYTETVYNTLGKPKETYDKLRRKMEYFYDARGNVTQTRYPDDTAGTDVDNPVTRTVYDADGRAFITTDRFLPGQTMVNGTRTIYDQIGRVVRTERLRGVVIALQSAGDVHTSQLVSAGLPISSTQTEYDAAGRVSVTTDARGHPTTYGYDAAGRRASIRNALGQVTTFGYDAAGNQTSMTDAMQRTMAYGYDDLNRRTLVTYPDQTTQLTTYDDLGRRIGERDQAGVTTGYRYDAQGRLIEVTNALNTPDQTITAYKYDGVGNLTEQKDAEGRSTTFGYDKLNRRIKRSLPGLQFERFFYDAVGNQTIHTNFDGRITDLRYDAVNRLLKKFDRQLGENNPWVAFTYTFAGQRETMTDRHGVVLDTTAYEYDSHNRLIRKTTPQGVLDYSYDANGNLLSMDSSNPGPSERDGVSVSYTWDPLNRLVRVTDNRLAAGAQDTTYTYDAVGNLKGYIYPNGAGTTYNYNPLNRLTDMAVTQGGSTLASFNYNPNEAGRTLGPAGNRRAARETINVTAQSAIQRNINYDYDPLYRVTKEQIILPGGNTVAGLAAGAIVYDATSGYGDPSSGLGFDRVGNRHSRTLQSANAALISKVAQFSGRNYDKNDRIDTDSNPHNANPNYDNNGNTLLGEVTPAQTASDEYDYMNRLTKRRTTLGGQAATIDILYDGDGNRVSKTVTVGGTVTRTDYLVDDRNPSGYAQVVEELVSINNAPSALDRIYVYGHDLISQSFLSPQASTSFYGYDGHGSVRFLLNSVGQISDAYNYEAFGILVDEWHAGSPTANNYLYAGEQFDPVLGLYYNRARYYSPNSGRFWTADSFEGYRSDPLSLHRYLYAADNPVNNTDPSGNEFVSAVLSIGNILSGLDSFVNNAQLVYKQAMAVAYRQRAFNLLTTVIRPTLNAIQSESGAKVGGEDAEYMLLGTAIAESGDLNTRKQRGGPALGLFQMEPFTHDDLWNTTLSKPNRKNLKDAILKHFNITPPPNAQLLESNDSYAAIMARVRYLPVLDPIPSSTDLNGQAQYWVQYYNRGGKATVADYLARWHRAMGL